MTTHINRRTALAAVAAVPAAAALATTALMSDPLGRIRLALEELESAFASYYADATSLKVTFNEIRPEDLATGSVAVVLVLADRLNDPRVSRTAHNPLGISA